MFERLLEPGSAEAPKCSCGGEMHFVRAEEKSKDAAVKHFSCDACARELMVMVWPESIARAMRPEAPR
jgi:hypothetical protein